jgi:hypothetical protein
MRVGISRRADGWRPFKKPVRDKLCDGYEEWLRERSAGLARRPSEAVAVSIRVRARVYQARQGLWAGSGSSSARSARSSPGNARCAPIRPSTAVESLRGAANHGREVYTTSPPTFAHATPAPLLSSSQGCRR